MSLAVGAGLTAYASCGEFVSQEAPPQAAQVQLSQPTQTILLQLPHATCTPVAPGDQDSAVRRGTTADGPGTPQKIYQVTSPPHS